MRTKPLISREVVAAARAADVNIENVVRQALGMPPLDTDGWTVKGVYFPKGTFFRTWYKDRPYWGEVRDGALYIEGKRYSTPSEATGVFVQPPINGWRVWEAKFPDSRTWVDIFDLRPEAQD